jgi:Fe-S cluster assembly protein SufD
MSAPLAIAERKTQAAERFLTAGLPNRRVEDWKYTDLRAILNAGTVADAGAVYWQIEALPEGVELFDLSRPEAPDWVEKHLGVLNGSSAMENASLAFAVAGFALRVPKGVQAGIARVRLSGAGHLRGLVMIEEGASLTLVERHAADAGDLRNVGMEILLCPDAACDHVRIVPRATDAVVTETVAVLLRGSSHYRAHFANFGAKLSRTDLHLRLEGEASAAELSGATVLGGADHADVTTHVEHVAGNARSTQVFKYIAGGKARAVYQGRITVAEGADGTDSRQTAKALLLSERAEADLKPELIINAEDVKCAHGAAVGDLDTEALYYLRTRGIAEAEARNLLIRAFLGEAVDEIADEDLRAAVWREIDAALPFAMEVLS